MLVDEDAAFGKRDPQMRRLDLKDDAFEGDGVIGPSLNFGTIWALFWDFFVMPTKK